MKNDNEKIWANKVVKKEKDLAEDENLKIDLTLVLFKENKEGDIEIAVTGKTFDILYKLNKKYEKNHKNSQSEIRKLNEKSNEKNNLLEELMINDSVLNENDNKVMNFKSFHQALR